MQLVNRVSKINEMRHLTTKIWVTFFGRVTHSNQNSTCYKVDKYNYIKVNGPFAISFLSNAKAIQKKDAAAVPRAV